MAWIKTIGPDEAEGALKAVYDEILGDKGRFVPKMRQLASLRPEVVEVQDKLAKRSHFGGTSLGRGREEMIAYVVAYHLNCSYCTIAHGGNMQRREGKSTEEIVDLACNYVDAGLDPQDIAMLDYAMKIAKAPESISERDIEGLREAGFDDTSILDIALATAYRVYVSRMAAALGIDAEEWWDGLDGELRSALTVGRELSKV